jgi:hypothetical protein
MLAFHATEPISTDLLNGCLGANLAVRWPWHEWPFTDGERKSAGESRASAERRQRSFPGSLLDHRIQVLAAIQPQRRTVFPATVI